MTAWAALLRGSGVESRAVSAVADIAAGLAEPAVTTPSNAAMRALALHSAGTLLEDDSLILAAGRWLEVAASLNAEHAMAPSLHGGWCGIGWTYDYLAGEDDEDPFRASDERLKRLVVQQSLDFDLVTGLAGIGVYAIERRRFLAGQQLGESVVQALARMAEGGLADAYWRRAGKIDVGLAHGVPGVVALLSRMSHFRIGGDESSSLLERATNWLMHVASQDPTGTWFPRSIDGEVRRASERSAWCYGDLGVAAALMGAARAAENDSWLRFALDLTESLARRPVGYTSDIGLCHGSLGNAHVLARLYQASGLAEVREHAIAWYQAGLEELLAKRGDSVLSDDSLMTGAPGVGLALSAALGSDPHWDRLLLVDVFW